MVRRSPGEAGLDAPVYLSRLSRYPDATDTKVSLEYISKAVDKRKAWEDLHWTLLNTKEFLFRH